LKQWPTVQLGEVVEFQAGVGFPVALQGRREGDMPFAKVGDISRLSRRGASFLDSADNFVSMSDLASLDARPVPPGSTLFAKIGEAIRHNHRVIASRPLLIDNNAMAATPSSRVDSKYLYRFLQTVDLYPLAASTTVPSLRKSNLQRIEMQLPPLDEQRRIALILDKASALVGKREAVSKKLAGATQSLFRWTFGRADASLRAEGTWSTIGNALKLKSGKFLPASKQRPGPFPVYGGNGVTGWHDEFMFDAPTVMVGRVGAYCGTAHLSAEKSWITDNALYVAEMRSEMSPRYLVEALKYANLNRYASQSGQPLISATRLAEVPLFIPSRGAQADFEARARLIDRQCDIAEMSRAKARALFASLQSRAFSSQL
jgi:type I restriction enzyme S subunit